MTWIAAKIPLRVTSRFRFLQAKVTDDRRGMAAVEFALVLPVLVLLWLGSVEVSQGVAIKRMVSLCAGTVANLVTQYPTISASQTMPDILNASTAVLTPYPASNAIVRVSLITIDGTGKATVTWSQAQNGTALPKGQTINLPAKLDVPNTSVVFGETTYVYNPASDYINVGAFNLYASVYMFPRASSGTVLLTP